MDFRVVNKNKQKIEEIEEKLESIVTLLKLTTQNRCCFNVNFNENMYIHEISIKSIKDFTFNDTTKLIYNDEFIVKINELLFDFKIVVREKFFEVDLDAFDILKEYKFELMGDGIYGEKPKDISGRRNILIKFEDYDECIQFIEQFVFLLSHRKLKGDIF